MSTGRMLPRVPFVYFACAIVCALLLVREWMIPERDIYHCRSLLGTGAWAPSSTDGNGRLRTYHKWEPSGCHLSYYEPHGIDACLSGRRVVFAGDSTIRQIFWAAAVELDPCEARRRMEAAEKHSNQRFEARGITLLYIWDTWLNGTELQAELDMFRHGSGAETSPPGPESVGRAGLVLVGTPAFWAAAFGGDEYVDIFLQGVSRIEGAIDQGLEDSIASSSSGHSADQILVSPVLYPEYGALNAERAETLTPEKLEYLNTLLAQSSPALNSRVLWSYNHLTHGLQDVHDEMGVHVEPVIARHQFQIALNARCNNAMGRTSPPKGTCCVAPTKVTPTQRLVGLPLVLMLCVRLLLWRFLRRSPGEGAFGHLVFASTWSWLADRSGVFSATERNFDPSTFPLLCITWMTVSFLVGKTTIPRRWRGANLGGYLAREQSDELKGLMQGVILIYHYTHSSRVLPVYKVVRLFIAMYLFLSAYGQSTYILQSTSWDRGADKAMPPEGFSKYRHLAAVLFRLNALSILLPFAMVTTNYASYYFAPCVSFWFLVTWTTLHIKPRWNLRPWSLTSKVLVALLVSHLLISAPGVLERASHATHWVFGLSWSAGEMRFRLSLDRFAPFAGISAAGWNFQTRTKLERSGSRAHVPAVNGTSKAREEPRVPESRTRRPTAWNNGLSLSRWLLPGGLCTVGLYLCIFVLPPPAGRGETLDKYTYNAFHPYISPLVVIALLALRNSTAGLRSAYLRLPAALGRISLETYVLQYHMWLANDATSILSLGLVDHYHGGAQGPVARSLQACLLTVVFLAMAQLTHEATQVLGRWMFGNRESSPWKGVARRGEVVRRSLTSGRDSVNGSRTDN